MKKVKSIKKKIPRPTLEKLLTESIGSLSNQPVLLSEGDYPKKADGQPAKIGDTVTDWHTPTGQVFTAMAGTVATLEWSSVVPGLKVVRIVSGGFVGNNYGILSGDDFGYLFLGSVDRDEKDNFIALIGTQDAELPVHSTIGKGLWMRSNWAKGFRTAIRRNCPAARKSGQAC